MERYRSYTLLDACALLHAHVTGSSDGMTLPEFEDMLDWLNYRSAVWSFGPRTSEYDRTVYALVSATINECLGNTSSPGLV